jgi:putative N6-adenine-specific DNA methylase
VKRRIPLGAPGKPKPGTKARPGKRTAGSAERTGGATKPSDAKKSSRRRKPLEDRPSRPRVDEPRPAPIPARRPTPSRLPDPATERLSLFAITAPGLEKITAAELRARGIGTPVIEAGGVAFTGTLADVYEANLWLRTASRIVIRVASFHASEFHELERRAKRVPWDRYIGVPARVRFRVTCRKSRLYHSDAVAERLAKIIAGVHGLPGGFTMAAGDEGVEDAPDADDAQLFVVRLVHDEVTISADSSGALLHRRGYRQAVAKAPLRETLAAAMVMGSGWDGTTPLADPMCGSGTIPIEAAMIARGMAPGIDHPRGTSRSFAFMGWAGFDDGAWRERIAKAVAGVAPRSAVAIIGADRDAGAIVAAHSNAARAGVADDIELHQQSISALELPPGPGWIISNPPYGVRLGDSAPLRNLYAQLGKMVRARAPGWTLAMLTADRDLERQVGVGFSDVFRTTNGGIPVRLVRGVVG